MPSLVEVKDLKKYFPVRGGIFEKKKTFVKAVDGVSFSIGKGETLGLVGESGCGKTTTGRIILRLLEPTEGEVHFDGNEIFTLDERSMKKLREDMQIVFQDPFASLNPRKSIRHILSQPYHIHKRVGKEEVENNVLKLLETVGLSPADKFVDRHPHEFSGGQRQRIGFARAIALSPKFIVADEPVSALDISVRAQVLNLMKRLQEQLRLTYLFITHDLAVLRSVAVRVCVMYLGKIVELAEVAEVFHNPLHPYTKAIISATPIPNPRKAQSRSSRRIILSGDPPSPIDIPKGCRFHTRCPYVKNRCAEVEPPMVEVKGGHYVACLFET